MIQIHALYHNFRSVTAKNPIDIHHEVMKVPDVCSNPGEELMILNQIGAIPKENR